MDNFYKYMMGRGVMRRPHNPSTTEQMRHFENLAWQHVARDISSGHSTNIDDALNKLTTNTIWTNHIFSYRDGNDNRPTNSPYKGTGKHEGN